MLTKSSTYCHWSQPATRGRNDLDLPMTAIYYTSAIRYVFLKAHLMRLAKPFQLKEKNIELSQLVKKAQNHKVQGLKKQKIYKEEEKKESACLLRNTA